jgi:hypothetical protein
MGIMGVTSIAMGNDVDGKNQDFVKEFMRKAGLNPRPVAWLYGVRNPDRGQHRSRVRHLYGLRRGRYGRLPSRRGLGELARIGRQVDVELRRRLNTRCSGRFAVVVALEAA